MAATSRATDPNEHARDLLFQAWTLLQPFEEAVASRTHPWGDHSTPETGVGLSPDGRDAAARVLRLVSRSRDELREIDHELGFFDEAGTLEVVVVGVAGVLAGTAPVAAGDALGKLARVAGEQYRKGNGGS